MISLYLLKSSISTRSFLTLVFTSLFLVSLGMISHNAFAMGSSGCYNEYHAPFVSFMINNGTKTFDALANPGVTFNSDGSFNVTFVMHTPSISSWNNTNPGDAWYIDDYFGFENGACIGPVGPNQNVTTSLAISNQRLYGGYVQRIIFGTHASSSATFNVQWLSSPQYSQNLQAMPSNAQIGLSWSAPFDNGGYPITNYKIYRSTGSGTETLLTTIGNVTSYTDTAITRGQTYFYKVTAVNSIGESAPSNEANATMPGISGDAVTATIPVDSPSGVGVDSGTNKIYVSNSGNNTISVIDGTTNTVTSTIPVGNYPLGVGVNPITHKIYVDNAEAYTVSVIDGTTNTVTSTIPVGSYPISIAVNQKTNMIYVGNFGSSNISVINGSSDTVVSTITPWLGYIDGVAVNPSTNMVYATTTCTCLHPYAYLAIINGTTNSLTTSIQKGNNGYGVGVNTVTNRIYADLSRILYVVDGVTNNVMNMMSMGDANDVGVNPTTNKIYMTNGNAISVIDGFTNNVVNTIPVGNSPTGIGVNSNTNKIYVPNYGSNTISVIDGNSSSTFTVPSVPQNLQATVDNSQVVLSWSAPSSNGDASITNYNVYRGTSSGTETLLTTVGNTTSYTDTTVTAGQTYFYKVTAVNFVGESSQSNETSATPTAPVTVSGAPTGLAATAPSSSQINLSWTAPANNGGSAVTGYMIERSTDNGTTWSTIASNTGSTTTTYNDTGLAARTTYTYRVSAINSVGTGFPSNTASATTGAIIITKGIALSNTQSTSGTVSSSNTITISNFNVGSDSNRLLVVGVSANNNDVASVTFGGASLTRTAYSFYNNDAEFWYLKNPSGTGDITVTMNGSTPAVVGAYAFSGVNQTVPIPTHVVKHNTSPTSPKISITTKYANDWVLDLPSIYGGSTLGTPTCTQQWDVNVPNAITGASSSIAVPTAGVITCGWTANSGDLYDDAAIEINAASR